MSKFDPKKEVPNKGLCQKLKALGFTQDGGGWYWIEQEFFGDSPEPPVLKWILAFREERPKQLNCIKAPTVRELGEKLPAKIEDDLRFELISIKMTAGWLVAYTDDITWFKGESMVEDTEADARAKMLIWLVENGITTFENRNCK